MKRLLLFVATALLIVFVACKKPLTERAFPEIAEGSSAQVTAAEAAWLEQMAEHERDSIRTSDSLRATTGQGVDTSSLFHKKNMAVAIVEVNDHLFANVICYKDEDGKNLFDLAFPFGANINVDPSSGKATVTYNPQQRAMIRLGVFDKIRNAGIPVGLAILGNHDEAGWDNFKTFEEATAFAQIVAREVRQKKFAAVLSDDEYSDRISDAHPASYVMVMSEIKRLLPATFLCYYAIGGGLTPYRNKKMGDVADVVFPPFYPDYPGPAYISLFNFPKSTWFATSSEPLGRYSDPESKMREFKEDGFRGMMFYNVSGTSESEGFYKPYFKGLKEKTLTVAPGCLDGRYEPFINGQ